jgi:hypothetical protein
MFLYAQLDIGAPELITKMAANIKTYKLWKKSRYYLIEFLYAYFNNFQKFECNIYLFSLNILI